MTFAYMENAWRKAPALLSFINANAIQASRLLPAMSKYAILHAKAEENAMKVLAIAKGLMLAKTVLHQSIRIAKIMEKWTSKL